jgi:hypothetical protein
MKLILITLVAVVVGLMVACESASRTSMFIPTSIPAYSDAEVVGAVRGHLTAVGMDGTCQRYGKYHLLEEASVSRDPSNPDKYFVTVVGNMDNFQGGSWTFIASLAKVISTSEGLMGVKGC